ncbi:uncharacterized protein LOC143071650 isoform X1 [Mytilus galloprovincialis]|uniref:uncharacterized protein LOC143071650 isoform X1 n=1 Tax=Mytilus galloprovincialis TaxID=29158 RepID=UPI003F7B82D3
MKKLLQLLTIVALECIVTTRILPDSCKVRSSIGCNTLTQCSLHVTFHLAKSLVKGEYLIYWRINGTKTNSNFTEVEYKGPCMSRSICAMMVTATLKLPRTTEAYGMYTVKLYNNREQVQCSTPVCKNCIIDDQQEEEDHTVSTDTQNNIYIYIIGGSVLMLMTVIISCTIVLHVVRKKAGRRPVEIQTRPTSIISNDQVSADEPSVAVSNHTYASVQLSVPSRYQGLLSRNVSRHHYNNPRFQDIQDESQGDSAFASTLTMLSSDQNNHNQRTERTEEPQLTRIPINILVSRLEQIQTNQSMPNLLVHDYQNIRRTRRLT